MNISTLTALEKLSATGNVFTTLFEHGTLSVEVYKPLKEDLQKPHDRDEVYVVISGRGMFNNGGRREPFEPGTFLFVPAFVEHRFESFTDDFVTWVFFFGPKGGEKSE